MASALAAAVCVAACSSSEGGGPDAGAVDAGSMDAGAPDAGAITPVDGGTQSDASGHLRVDAGDWRPGGRLFNLFVELHGLDEHVGELLVLRMVDVTVLVSHTVAILDGVRGPDESWLMPLAIPWGHHDFVVYADHDGSRTYGTPPADHAWRVHRDVLGADGPDVRFVFTHDALFSDIATPPDRPLGGELRVAFSGFAPEVGRLFELHVIETDTGRTSALYRLAAVPGDSFAVVVPGIVMDGTPYDIDFYVDVDGNGHYDAPPVDHAWRISTTGGATGLALDFGYHLELTDVRF